MKCTLDHTRTVFIHDHDGVHYRYLDNPDYISFLSDAKGEAASALLSGLTREQASIINTEYYAKYHDGSRGFYELAVRQGHTLEDFRLKLHHEYHRVAYQRMKKEYPDWIRPCAETREYMQQLSGHIRHAILTQGCPENWAKPNLAHIGILQHFEVFLGSQDTDFLLKSESTRPIELALEAMNAKPYESVFIEDTLKNLAKAKERFPDLCTVYICDDKPLETLPDYVDIQVDTFKRLKQAVMRLHKPDAALPALQFAA